MIDFMSASSRTWQEAAPFINKHIKLTDDYGHVEWAKCKCEVAREIHKVFATASRSTVSDTIRLNIDLKEFGELVRGAIVAKTRDGKRVLIALADIGFDEMLEQVALARLK